MVAFGVGEGAGGGGGTRGSGWVQNESEGGEEKQTTDGPSFSVSLSLSPTGVPLKLLLACPPAGTVYFSEL